MDKDYLLWKISGKDLKSPSYILGTIHLICPEDYIWTDAMQQALSASEKVAFELDMDDPGLQMKVALGMSEQNGKSLKDYFSESEYEQFSEFTQENLGASLSMFDHMKPVALMSMISMKAVDCANPVSYEEKIMELATEADKEIVGLESAEDQLRIFNEMNSDSTAKQLISSLNDWEKMKTQYKELLSFYKKQDMEGLYKMVLDSPDFKDNLDVLLFDRNERWIPKIEDLAKAQSMFFAVGAGHLWGDKGVLHLLRNAGYKVEGVR